MENLDTSAVLVHVRTATLQDCYTRVGPKQGGPNELQLAGGSCACAVVDRFQRFQCTAKL